MKLPDFEQDKNKDNEEGKVKMTANHFEEKEDGVENEGHPDGYLDKRVKIMLGILIIVLVGLVLFAVFYSDGDVYEYKSPSGEVFQFKKISLGEGNMLHVLTVYVDEQGGMHQYNLPLRYGPKDVEGIPFDEKIVDKVLWHKKNDGWFFFTLDPYGSNKLVVARNELSRILGVADFSLFDIPGYGAFTKDVYDEEGNLSYPLKVCADDTGRQGVIWFKLGDENRVYIDDCIIVEGKDYDEIIRASDRFVYGILRIM